MTKTIYLANVDRDAVGYSIEEACRMEDLAGVVLKMPIVTLEDIMSVFTEGYYDQEYVDDLYLVIVTEEAWKSTYEVDLDFKYETDYVAEEAQDDEMQVIAVEYKGRKATYFPDTGEVCYYD